MNKKVLISIIAFIILASGIVAGVVLVQKNQDIREKAAPATSLSFLPASQNKNPGQTINLVVNANTGENKITGVDIEVSFNPAIIQMSQMSATSAISNFSTVIKNGEINNTTGKARFVAFTAVKSQAVSGNLDIITLTGTVANNAVSGASQLTFSSTTTVSAVDEGVNVIINKSPATIVVSGGGASATATSTTTPTSTAIPTKSPSPTPTAGIGGGDITVQATVPPDLPVTGISMPLIGGVGLGMIALIFSLFLVF